MTYIARCWPFELILNSERDMQLLPALLFIFFLRGVKNANIIKTMLHAAQESLKSLHFTASRQKYCTFASCKRAHPKS